MLSQRAPNFAGVLGMESSPFGYMYGKMLQTAQDIQEPWDIPFYCLRIRSWRDTARYAGFEALENEGPEALKRLPMLMEEIFESWEKGKASAQFKAENMIRFNGIKALTEAAWATAMCGRRRKSSSVSRRSRRPQNSRQLFALQKPPGSLSGRLKIIERAQINDIPASVVRIQDEALKGWISLAL